jgi:hypothetical protein
MRAPKSTAPYPEFPHRELDCYHCCSASIQIGGKILRSSVQELVLAGCEDGAGQNYQPAEIEVLTQKVELAARNREPVLFTAGDAILGAFDVLETTCRELGLSYLRYTKACQGAWSEHVEFWRPDMHPMAAYKYACNGYGRPMLDYRQIRRLNEGAGLERELQIMEHIHLFPYPLTIIEDGETVMRSSPDL